MAKARKNPLRWLSPAVVIGASMPAATLLWLSARGELGANPVAEALNQLGLVALTLLIASLACTPLKIVSGWTWPFRLRRTLGLLGFAYVLLHALVYAILDQTGNVPAIWQDVTKRMFIFVGFSAFVLLIPLALTSTAASIRRLGSKKWKRLHQLAYVIGILGVIHFIWRVKADLTEPLIYAAILGVLFLTRFAKRLRDRAKSNQPTTSAA